jgi:hypothetical protein
MMYLEVSNDWGTFTFFSIVYLFTMAIMFLVAAPSRLLEEKPRYFFLLIPIVLSPLVVSFLMLRYEIVQFPKKASFYGGVIMVLCPTMYALFQSITSIFRHNGNPNRTSKRRKNRRIRH